MFRIFILMLLGVFAFGCDNEIIPSEVPSVVENTFKTHFPNATEVEWELYGEDFEVDFEVNQIDHSARIDNAGNMLEYKYEIAENTLPSTIITALKTEYSNKKWEDPEVLVTAENSYYQVEIDNFLNDKKIVFDSTGNKIENIKYWN